MLKNNAFSYMIITGVLFSVLVGIAGINFYYRSRWYTTGVITQDLKTLQDIFKRIDESCTIMSFDAPITPINYLNVGSFEGSEIGAMNIVYPSRWEGPYVKDNPTIQGFEYQIVHTNKGYFITPGNGVTLPNGKEIGKDIVFDEKSDIAQMLTENGGLLYKGTAFAVVLPLKSTAWQQVLLEQTLAS
jgi:hypothetical protein